MNADNHDEFMPLFDERKVVVHVDGTRLYIHAAIYDYIINRCSEANLDPEIVLSLIFNIPSRKLKTLSKTERKQYETIADDIKEKIAKKFKGIFASTVTLKVGRKRIRIPGYTYELIKMKCEELQLDVNTALKLLCGMKKIPAKLDDIEKYKALLEYLRQIFYDTLPIGYEYSERVIPKGIRQRITKTIKTIKEIFEHTTLVLNITVHPLIYVERASSIGYCITDTYRNYTYYIPRGPRRFKTIKKLLRELFGKLIHFELFQDMMYIFDSYIVERAEPGLSVIDCWLRENLSESFDRKIESESCWVKYYVHRVELFFNKKQISSNIVLKTYDCDIFLYSQLCGMSGICSEHEEELLKSKTIEKLKKAKIITEEKRKKKLSEKIKEAVKKIFKVKKK